jgi:Bacterial protein of unknown function (DUF894).
MIKALKNPQLLRLWFGQASSSVGDEIYRVGLTWFAVGLMGANTGYLTAGQTASLMLLSFIGGKWADRWQPIKTLVSVDLIRAAIVIIPVAISYFTEVPMAVLWGMALSLSALSAFFDPAVQSIIPTLAKDKELMHSTNGLMSTTIRMARMVGPAIVGLLSAFIPMIHFFTIDAITFIVSAYCVYSLKKHVPEHPPAHHQQSMIDAITSGFKKVRQIPGMSYVFFSRAVTAGTWNLALVIGFALLVHQMTNGDAKSFGLVMASYGVGNFAGALYFGNRPRPRSEFLMYSGYMWLGLGFVCIGVAPTIPLVMIAAAAGGFSGPMNDLAFIDMAQQKFEVKDLTKVFRLRMAVESAATLLCTVTSPWLIKHTSIRAVIIGCGVTWILSGVFGFVLAPQKETIIQQ